jgi:hypothetical protein
MAQGSSKGRPVRDRSRVFISYSRKDLALAQALRDRLIEEGFDAYLDLHDIVKGEPWQERLRSLVEASDTVLFLISPDSVASSVCEWEVNEAERLEKRLFPVMVRATPSADIPQRLQRLNFTFLDQAEKWPAEFSQLLLALKQDVNWVREHTRLSELAVRWERAGRPMRNLLQGADLAAAERWRDTRPPAAPRLSSLLAEFLRHSREGSQRRLRNWLVAAAVLAFFAVGLSTFAYWQRTLAVDSANVAERRAAALATDVAITRAEQGSYDESLLLLLDASTRYAPEPVPEKLLLALRDVTTKASLSRTHWFSAGARAFHLAEAIVVADPVTGAIYLIEPLQGGRREVAAHPGTDITDMVMLGRSLVFLTIDGDLYRVDTEQAVGRETKPVRLASLSIGAESEGETFGPTMRLAGDHSLVGLHVTRKDGATEPTRSLWRFDVQSGELSRFDIRRGAHDLLRTDARAAYFGKSDDAKILALSFDTGEWAAMGARAAVERGISPCRQQDGQPNADLLQAVLKTVRPEFERVYCAGIYGEMALMSRDRAFARWMREEYFLLPAGETADRTKQELALLDAVEHLGALDSEQPFVWYAGSADGGAVAVSHADRILLLGRGDTGFVPTTFFADGRISAREIATPGVTDGGAFYGADRFAYSGAAAPGYRVTVLNTQYRAEDSAQVDQVPERAYWGSCGVQKANQGDRQGVSERRFVVERAGDRGYRIRLGDRLLSLALDEIRCASASADGSRLAVVDASGLRLFDTTGSDDLSASSQLAHIEDPTINTASFVGERQQVLLTAHPFKVTAWRAEPTDDNHRAYRGETVYRSTRRLLFAEGAPDAERMLVWQARATAEASVELVPIPHAGRAWFEEQLLWLVNQPDLFFGTDGAVYRVEDDRAFQVMPAVQLTILQQAAEKALSPGCLPSGPGVYRSSPCWPTNR